MGRDALSDAAEPKNWQCCVIPFCKRLAFHHEELYDIISLMFFSLTEKLSANSLRKFTLIFKCQKFVLFYHTLQMNHVFPPLTFDIMISLEPKTGLHFTQSLSNIELEISKNQHRYNLFRAFEDPLQLYTQCREAFHIYSFKIICQCNIFTSTYAKLLPTLSSNQSKEKFGFSPYDMHWAKG